MKATEQQLQEIYEEAVAAEIATQNGTEMALFDLLCKLDEVGGMANFIRSMIEQVRAANSDREMLKRLAVILSGSDAPGEIRSLTVTAQSFVDRCKTLAKERDFGTEFPAVLPCPVFLEPGLRFGKGVLTSTMLGALQRRAEYYAELEEMTPEEREKHDASIEEFKAMLPHRAPAAPAGYALVPVEPTEAMMLNKSSCQHHAWDDPDCSMRQTRRFIWKHMIEAAQKPEQQ